jgi:DNA-binding CsgD family transcriptional regulator
MKSFLTEKELIITLLAENGLNDYKIARKLKLNPSSAADSYKNARRKVTNFKKDTE